MDRVDAEPAVRAPRLHWPEAPAGPLEKEALAAGDGPLVALAPGASWPTKRWPAESWRALGDALAGRGCAVIELGALEEATGAGRDFTGRTSIHEAGRLLQRCRLLVCNDSGLLHLGLAAGTQVLALYGPTDPGLYYAPAPRNLHVLTNGRPCRGCWNGVPEDVRMEREGVCPLGIDPCMGSLAPDTVAAKAAELLTDRGCASSS
jgi:ADP-heptose:LPS heptosyltransferase